MLFRLLKKKSKLEELYEKYEELRIEAYRISQIDKAKSEELLKEAKKISDEIDKLNASHENN
ncbi:MAG: Lacal_2735 family protein [Thermaurantimonas sp.]|uniref:Lacal_2735 family protein n=1 Tax=Thermaurantimonas sp. TaxID=2681568 RepID=UPI003919F4C1